MKILYVEDEFAHVVLAQRTLEENIRQEFELIHAETIGDALRLLDAEPNIDLVLSDLRLPDGTGLDLLKRVRERKSAPAVVLVTGQGDQEVAVAALKAGAADYLVKQSDYLHRLPVVISNAIAQNRLLREQEALRQAEIKYQSLVEQISAVVFLDRADEEETTLYISPRIQGLTGYTADEWYASQDIWVNLIHPDDLERILAEDKKSHENGTHFLEEYRIIRRDGSTVWVKEDTGLICDKDGVPLYWQGILLDITKEKESLEIIRKSEDRFRRIFHASPIATCVVRMDDGKFMDANQAYLNLTGQSLEKLMRQNSVEMGLWKDEENRNAFLKRLQEYGTLQGIEHQYRNVPAGIKDTIAYYELIELGGQICVLAMFYDVTEEKKAQKALQTERDFALQVLNTMGQGLTVTQKDGRFEYVNPAFAGMLGYKPEEIIGRTPFDFTSEASLQHLKDERALRKQGITSTYESILVHKTSHEVPALITGVPRLEDDKVTGTIAVVTDLTEHKKTEEALARQVKELTVLHSVAIAETESQSEDEIIERVTKICGQIYPELCGFLLLNEKGDHLSPHSSYHGANIPNWQDSYPVTSGITGRAVLLDKIIRIGDVTQVVEYVEIASGIQSELCIPIRINGRIIGILNVESKNPNAFGENDERFLNTIASSVGTALERLRFFKEEQRRSKELNALYQATKSLAQSLKPEVIAENLIATMDELLEYEFASLYLLDDDGQYLIPLAISRKAQNLGIYEKDMELLRHEKRALEQGILGWVAQNGQSIRTGDVDREPRYLQVIKNIKSELCVPLIARGNVIGTLNIESVHPNAYGEQDESLLTALANSAAISFENARLYKSELIRREQAEILRTATASLSTALDLNTLYKIILDSVTKLVPYDRASIETINQGGLEIVAERGLVTGNPRIGQQYSWDSNKWGEWKDLGRDQHKPMIRADVQSEDGSIKSDNNELFHSWMGIPMVAGDKVFGLINLDHQKSNFYTEEHAAIVQTFANQAGIAIEKAKLYRDALLSAERRAVLHRISQDIVRFSQDSEQIYAAIHEAAGKLMPCDVFIITLRDAAKNENISVYTVEAGNRFEPVSVPARNGLTGAVINEGRSIILRNDEEIGQREVFHFGSPKHVQAVVSVPLRIGDQVIGMISAQSYKPYAYDVEEQALLEMLATHAATAIENARLFQEQSRRSKIIEVLADIANEIATTREVFPALDQIARRALDLLNANHVAIYLLQEDNVTLKTMTAHGTYRKELLGHTRKVGEGITGSIFLSGKPEIINDTREDARRVIIPGTPEKEEKLESLMSSPLILRGKPIGMINAWRLKENGLFNESELNFLVGIAHQVSICIESGRLFQETNRQAQEAAAIAEVGRDISATLQLDVVMERIAAYAMNLLHAETSAVYLTDTATSTLRAIAALGADSEAIKNDPLPIGTGILGHVALQNIGEIVNDTANDPRSVIVKGTEKNPLEHIMGVPILLKDRHTGLLAVWRSGISTEFTPRELEFLTSLARQAAVAIENARLYDEAQRRLKELEIINHVSTSLRMTQSLDEMLPILLNETLGLLNTPNGAIWMYDHTSNMLIQEIASGAESKLRYKALSPVDGIVGRTFTSGKRYISPELKNDPLLFELNRESMTPGLAGICIPIQSTAGPVGVVMIAVEQGQQTTDAINLLTILAEITGNSIHRVQLYEQSQKQVRRLTTLRDIDAAIASSFDLRLTLNILMDQTLNHLNVDAVDVGLYHPDIQGLTYLASAGFQTPTPTRPQVRLGEGLAGQVIVKQSILHVTDLQNAPEANNEVLIRREGFVTYIGIPLIVKGQIKGVFEVFHRTPLSPTLDWMEFLHTLAGQAAIAIDSSQLFENLQRSNQELMQAYDTTLEGWARALELRDRETEGHTRRVTEQTLRLARFMGISDSEMVNIHRGVLLHDIGKMGVPDHILKKTGKLDDDEWAEMRQHPVYAYNLLSPISYLRGALDIPYCHHEHWDGSGYPRGLKEEQIPLSARIFSVVDIWDALLSDRPYRKAWSQEKVVEYIKDVAGSILDPKIVEVFFKMLDREKNRTG